MDYIKGIDERCRKRRGMNVAVPFLFPHAFKQDQTEYRTFIKFPPSITVAIRYFLEIVGLFIPVCCRNLSFLAFLLSICSIILFYSVHFPFSPSRTIIFPSFRVIMV